MVVTIEQMLKEAIARDASDIFLVAGHPYAFKINGEIHSMQETRLMPNDTAQLIQEIYQYALQNTYEDFLKKKDDDFSFSIPDVGRFRCNVYLQRNSQAAVLRVVRFELPDPVELNIPQVITSLAAVIEYLHAHKKSIVSQREVYHDTQDYLNALRSALREAPEVILVGEMRDLETINTAVTAAETGHLILSTLHTMGAANTIDRMIDVFPSEQQQQIRVQLSMTLHAVISEQLVPATDGGIIPVFEIMIVNPAIRTQIREGKIHQLENSMIAGRDQGMITMDESLMKLYEEGRIDKEAALMYASNSERMRKKLNM